MLVVHFRSYPPPKPARFISAHSLLLHTFLQAAAGRLTHESMSTHDPEGTLLCVHRCGGVGVDVPCMSIRILAHFHDHAVLS